MWWSNSEQRRHQKEHIKTIIKHTKLNERAAQPAPAQQPSNRASSPPSLCHSVPTSDTFSDGLSHTRAASVESQLSLDFADYGGVMFEPLELPMPMPMGLSIPMPPPSFCTPQPAYPLFSPYEVDIKTERQTFVNDVPTRRDSTISTFSSYQLPPSAGFPFPTENWFQQDYFESRRESFAEEPLDLNLFDFTHGPFTPSHQAVIQVDECDRHLLSHFLDNVVRLIFPILEVNRHGSARADVILPALESNRTYLHCCLSIAAQHLKATEQLSSEEADGDIMRHRYATISELCEALGRDSDHAHILEATLGMIFFQCSVGRPDDSLPDIPWHQHFQAATSLIQKLDLPRNLLDFGTNQTQPPFNMTLAAWIDILGATHIERAPNFADTYREKLMSRSTAGLAELMGCEDRIMFLISEIACLESLKLEGMEDVALCAHIKLLGDEITLTEPEPGTIASPYSSTGAIRPRQLCKNMTAVFRLAARIYLCSLVPDFDRQTASIANLVNAVTNTMSFIPAGADGFDRSLVWPLLVAGAVSLPGSAFRSMFADRAARLGDAGSLGSFGRAAELLKDVWRINDEAAARGERQTVRWASVMKQKNWDSLLI